MVTINLALHYFVHFPGAGVPVSVAAGEVGGAAVLIVHLEDVPGEGSSACHSRFLKPLHSFPVSRMTKYEE